MANKKKTELLSFTESFVQKLMFGQNDGMMIAHDYKHVDRVRKWALYIARGEVFKRLEIIEVTALLHDIGLTRLTGTARKEHARIGAKMADEFLHENSKLNEQDIELISDAIKYHSSSPQIVKRHFSSLGNKRKLLEILRDADNLDAFGAIGIMRAFISKYNLPMYDLANIKGNAWELSVAEYKNRFGAASREVLAPVNTTIDQLNQQINYFDNLHTRTAKEIAAPLIGFMKDFILQLEREVLQTI
jgi:uncharacterized protein